VQELEDNELFEQTLLRGSQAALEQQPSTSDIDALMRSMMVARSTSIGQMRQQSTWTNDTDTTNRSWAVKGYGARYDRSADISFLNSGIKVGKRSRNGSTRNG
jgi:hypothetical protein